MRIVNYKGRVLGNSLNIYNFYKQATGRGLQADVASLSRLTAINDKFETEGYESLTDDEIEAISKIDALEVLSGLYIALRKGGDPQARRKTNEEILDELSAEDIANPELLEKIVELLGTKKE